MKITELEKTYSPWRVALLIRNQLASELPVALIVAGIVIGINLLFLILGQGVPINSAITGTDSALVPGPYWGIGIMLLGLYLASRAFKHMHGRTGTDWLLLPATTAEKFSAGALWIMVIWPIASSLAAMVSSAFLAGLAVLTGNNPGLIWHPCSSGGLEMLSGYWSAAAVLLAGSATFRKNALIKTVGLVFAAFLAIGLLSGGLAHTLLRTHLYDGSIAFVNGNFQLSGNPQLEAVQPWLQGIADFWRLLLLPVFALTFACFKVAEKEASDEVQ
ncbi:MAG: hypothetical protein ABIJ86_12575 [Spirochaetota bacterium]